jgi:Holliday junction DNA helicase RuvA
MIAYLEGKLAHKETHTAIIDVNGVGYFVRISLHTYEKLPALESRVKLYTFLQIREDAHTLYAFFDLNEKNVFEWLISISGVGGNTAITLLSWLTPSEIVSAIRKNDVQTLKNIKGIGLKTAERIIVELRDKAGKTEIKDETPQGKLREEAVQALMILGLPRALVEKQVDAIISASTEDLKVEEIIKKVLKK